VICGSIARSFGSSSRVWQLSMMAGAIAEPSMSESCPSSEHLAQVAA
jgi:hypothetical protein